MARHPDIHTHRRGEGEKKSGKMQLFNKFLQSDNNLRVYVEITTMAWVMGNVTNINKCSNERKKAANNNGKRMQIGGQHRRQR